jgi:hypothetical protein
VPAKHTSSRSSKTDCLNKLYKNTHVKRKTAFSNTFKGDISKATSMILNIIEKKDGKHNRNNEEEEDDEFSYQRSLSKDEEKNMSEKKGENIELDKTGTSFQKRNLKISIPTANSNKYIKDLMFPDSKGSQMKEEAYVNSPQFGGGYGRRCFKKTKCKSSIKRIALTCTPQFCPARAKCSFNCRLSSLVVDFKVSKCRRPFKTRLEARPERFPGSLEESCKPSKNRDFRRENGQKPARVEVQDKK